MIKVNEVAVAAGFTGADAVRFALRRQLIRIAKAANDGLAHLDNPNVGLRDDLSPFTRELANNITEATEAAARLDVFATLARVNHTPGDPNA